MSIEKPANDQDTPIEQVTLFQNILIEQSLIVLSLWYCSNTYYSANLINFEQNIGGKR